MLKVVLIVGVALILGGGLIYGAAYAIGERRNDANTGDFQQAFQQTANLLNLKVNVEIGRVNINRSSGSEITIDAKDIIEENFTSEIVNDTLEVSYRQRRSALGFISIPGITTGRRTPVININIPEGMIFENVDIDGGVGEYNIEYIHADSLVLSSGVGKINVSDSRIDRLRVDAGVGETNIRGDIGEMNISGGIGRITVTGSVARDIRVNGGVGEIRLDLAGDISNYNVSADSGIGAVRINGERADYFIRNTNAPYRLTASGGVGSITININ